MDKKVSIVTCCFNSAATIKHTFESVLSQVDDLFEYVIVDGGSTDGTLDIIREYEPKFGGKMKWKSEPDKGLYDAFNKGVNRCEGDLIGIINSDDWYEGNCIREAAQAMTDDPYQVVYGMVRFVDGEGAEQYVELVSHNLLKKRMINHPGCFVTKATYEKFGVFDTRWKAVADFDLMYRYYMSGQVKFNPVYSIWANFAITGQSYSYNGAKERYDFLLEKGLISKPEYIYRVAGLKGLQIAKRKK